MVLMQFIEIGILGYWESSIFLFKFPAPIEVKQNYWFGQLLQYSKLQSVKDFRSDSDCLQTLNWKQWHRVSLIGFISIYFNKRMQLRQDS